MENKDRPHVQLGTSVPLPLSLIQNDSFIRNLNATPVEEICKLPWFCNYKEIQRISQGLTSYSSEDIDLLTGMFTTHEKIEVLIHDIISTEVWNEKVFPHIKVKQLKHFYGYCHEQSLLHLLWAILNDAFQKKKMIPIGRSAVDIADYCCRHFTMVAEGNVSLTFASMNKYAIQNNYYQFWNSSLCVLIMMTLAYFINSLHPDVARVLFIKYDLPVLLVKLLTLNPWGKTNERQIKFQLGYFPESRQWSTITEGEFSVRSEMWTTLNSLFTYSRALKELYDVSIREVQLRKLLPLLDELIVKAPHFLPFKKTFTEMLMKSGPSVKDGNSELAVTVRNVLLNNGKDKWEQLARNLENHVAVHKEQYKHINRNCYHIRFFKKIPPSDKDGKKRCTSCYKEATVKCPRCGTHWYCEKRCQILHWPEHKLECDFLNRLHNHKILNGEHVK